MLLTLEIFDNHYDNNDNNNKNESSALSLRNYIAIRKEESYETGQQ